MGKLLIILSLTLTLNAGFRDSECIRVSHEIYTKNNKNLKDYGSGFHLSDEYLLNGMDGYDIGGYGNRGVTIKITKYYRFSFLDVVQGLIPLKPNEMFKDVERYSDITIRKHPNGGDYTRTPISREQVIRFFKKARESILRAKQFEYFCRNSKGMNPKYYRSFDLLYDEQTVDTLEYLILKYVKMHKTKQEAKHEKEAEETLKRIKNG